MRSVFLKMPHKKIKVPFKFKNASGIEYEVTFRKPDRRHSADGLCSDPKDDAPKIQISPYLTKQSELNTSIHEFAHAFFWDKPENVVAKFASALSRFLYNERSWRKIEK
ncbi:hypothetical protein CMI37_28480 [Candidatus Pacearchaeota archaeon]|nr:hypothetical protein [Candidatus Pacearchaeota archaeon]|tara:strand:- start:300 stop:626 length:327 start_codon:yes stop_codon:yes gene_type:complete